MYEPAESDRVTNSTQTTTEQGQGEDSPAAGLDFGKIRHDIGKYLLTQLSHQPRRASSGDRRYLNPVWVFWNRDNYESELSHALSSASFSELVTPSVSHSLVIKYKIKTALTHLVLRERCVLIQFWAPTTIGGQCLLTTSGQPFGLGLIDQGLCSYRMDSLRYNFLVEGGIDDKFGLPGRVFRKKLPEWTPNVRHYSAKDYPQRDHALNCKIQGSLALPVFEPYGHQCVGVLELVTYQEYHDCTYEVQEVCKALKNVDLTSSNIFSLPCLQVHLDLNTNISGEGYQNKLDEIFKGLEVVCNTHRLPLAQTWVVSECRSILANNQRLNKSCGSFDRSCMGQVCMSTANLPFYLSDAHMWQFRKACTEHHLRKEQGVVGLALSMYSLCLSTDVTGLKETEYPFIDLAIKYGLSSCFAICLWNIHTGKYDYIIEFFLPPTIKDPRDMQSLVESILITLKQHFQNFKAASASDLVFTKIILVYSNGRLESIPISQSIESPAVTKALAIGGEKPQLNLSDLQLMEEDEAINNNGNTATAKQSVCFNTSIEKKNDSAITFAEKKSDHDFISSEKEESRKKPSRKRRKNEKSISLENIKQQYGKTIEDAAETLAVSRSTLKRFCRQHGIDRWPSRKREKDKDSFPKLKQTKESTRGTEGAFDPTLSLNTRSGFVDPTFQPVSFISPEQPNSRLVFQDGVLRNLNDRLSEGRPTEGIVNSKKYKNLSSLGAGGSIPEANGTNRQLYDLPPQQPLVSVAVKATYNNDNIKFSFPLSVRMVELEKQVARRLKLKHGSFVLKYLDGDGDWILITCDTDLYYALGNLGSSDNTTFRLLVQPITN